MPYVELHCHSAFSFLDGASHPTELAAAAAEQGHPALALTDHDGLYGAMEFAQATKALGVRPITGAELTLDDGHHLTLLCEDRGGYRNLCRLITGAHASTRAWIDGGEEQPPRTPLAALTRERAEGLVCLSGCARRGAVAARVERGEHAAAAAIAERLLDSFGRERFRIELQRPFARHDRRRNRLLAQLAERLGVASVATGNVHMHDVARGPLQDAFSATRLGRTLDESEAERRGNRSHALAAPGELAERFADHPEAVHEAGRLAERLRFDLTKDLGYGYPGAEDESADGDLAELCRVRLAERYGGRRSRAEAEQRLEEELRVIRALGLSGFFLLHRDMLELAHEVAREVRGASAARSLLPPGRGRGSSVASIVCYLTGLSHVDPIEKALSLGRFLNTELDSLPDIDIDLPRDIRERLIPRVHERYGPDHAALVAAFPSYRTRGAVRDIGKALGLPPAEIERVARTADPWQADGLERKLEQAIGPERARGSRWRWLTRLVREAAALPRHAGQHPGGMVISTQRLDELCPIQPAAMEGRRILQWDKDSCADAGFLKIDLLGLGMLSVVERCVEQVARVRGERIDLSRIPYDDQEVYGRIRDADTMGTFQIESRAQMQMLRRSKPRSLDDLTVQVAIVRPGPIQGGAVHPYLERRKALREDPSFEVPYEHPSLEPVLRDTLGAIVFQDQVIEVAIALAGFSVGEAEGLRRAMSRKRSEAALRAYERRFVEGATARGASVEVAERVYSKIVGFSGFGFPKSHAAAFALLAYQSSWLRVHYAPEFLCGLLNEQPMGFYPPDTLIHEAQRRGIAVLAPCVRASEAECSVQDGGAVRLGLGYVNGVCEQDVGRVVEERRRGGFESVTDLVARCGASRSSLELLAWAGALDSLVEGGPLESRRRALWLLGATAPGLPLGPDQEAETQLALALEPAEPPSLRELSAWERMLADYGATGVTLAEHPLALMRPGLPERALTSEQLAHAAHGTQVVVAGLVVARQRPATANGITFMLLEDELGTINLIVPPPVHDRCRSAVRGEPIVLAAGRLEHHEGNVNVLVSNVERLERSDLPHAEVRQIEPRVAWSNDAGEDHVREDADLRAVAPAGHSFGRRGR